MKLNEEYEHILRDDHSQELSEARKRVWERLDMDNEGPKSSVRSWIPWLLLLLLGLVSAYLWYSHLEDRERLQHTVDELRVELQDQKEQWSKRMEETTAFTQNQKDLQNRVSLDTIFLRDTVYHQPKMAEKVVETITRVDTVYRSVIEERKVEVPVIRYDTVYIDRPIKEEMLVQHQGERSGGDQYPDEIRIVLDKDDKDDKRLKIRLSKPFK